jgi:hypothetical protein
MAFSHKARQRIAPGGIKPAVLVDGQGSRFGMLYTTAPDLESN